jgi:hypothetical protein
MASMNVSARLSASRKYIVCGACSNTLARRQFSREGPLDAPRKLHRAHWDTDWEDRGDHIARSASGRERLALGNAPIRKGWNTRTLSPYPTGIGYVKTFDFSKPAECDRCGALNDLDPGVDALDVTLLSKGT